MLYHLHPRELVGPRLRPLGELRVEQSELYERYARKYEGREAVLEDRVPGLGCRWSDVLFLTAVPPGVIRELHEEAGFEVPPLRWFEIDPAKLDPKRLRIYWYRYEERARKLEAENWSAFDRRFLPDLRMVPEATREHYRNAKRAGRRPFAFFRTPHVLYRGSLEIARLRIVEG